MGDKYSDQFWLARTTIEGVYVFVGVNKWMKHNGINKFTECNGALIVDGFAMYHDISQFFKNGIDEIICHYDKSNTFTYTKSSVFKNKTNPIQIACDNDSFWLSQFGNRQAVLVNLDNLIEYKKFLPSDQIKIKSTIQELLNDLNNIETIVCCYESKYTWIFGMQGCQPKFEVVAGNILISSGSEFDDWNFIESKNTQDQQHSLPMGPITVTYSQGVQENIDAVKYVFNQSIPVVQTMVSQSAPIVVEASKTVYRACNSAYISVKTYIDKQLA